ncbi:hypothetical protein [Desulfospira joergensenii]|uniref:hypothetical protein n=1 Tax=Desulfospira joergensenii TaxID=53329 RepID=UPI0003B73D2E|nr:hypothetical protein [Desulfospira joergensenii]
MIFQDLTPNFDPKFHFKFTEGKLVFGFNKKLTGHFWKDFFTQGGPLSKSMNYIPGMNAMAHLHDFWMNSLFDNMLVNFGTMPLAAAITYGSVLGGAHAPMTVPIYTGLRQRN